MERESLACLPGFHGFMDSQTLLVCKSLHAGKHGREDRLMGGRTGSDGLKDGWMVEWEDSWMDGKKDEWVERKTV